jgi:hypothetical protein
LHERLNRHGGVERLAVGLKLAETRLPLLYGIARNCTELHGKVKKTPPFRAIYRIHRMP